MVRCVLKLIRAAGDGALRAAGDSAVPATGGVRGVPQHGARGAPDFHTRLVSRGAITQSGTRGKDQDQEAGGQA